MKILLFDNYDSFTYDLLHILKELGVDVEAHRNDKISLEEIECFDKILLSPGPSIPEEASILLPLIRRYAPTRSILGIYLGEQVIGEVFGVTLTNLTGVHRGACSDTRIVAKDPTLEGLEPGICVGRYHSWVVSEKNFSDCLEITAVDMEERQIMGLRHCEYDVRGIQFHPESMLTPKRRAILENWLKR